MFNRTDSIMELYWNNLLLNTYTLSQESQVDLIIDSVLISEVVHKYSYKNGTRVLKGNWVVDQNGKKVFDYRKCYSYLTMEPWTLKASRQHAKMLLKSNSTGDPNIQNLRAIFLNFILKHRVEQNEFKIFYKMFSETYENDKEMPADVKKKISTNFSLTKEELDKLTDKVYNLTMANDKPLRIDCEMKLISDSYLASFSRFCSDYVKGAKLENLIVGNSFPDVEKSIEKISILFTEFLKKKIKSYSDEASRKNYLSNVEKINKKYLKLIELTEKNCDDFFKDLKTIYNQDIEDAAKELKTKKENILSNFKENFDVFGYLLWEFLAKDWMRNEILAYFDTHRSIIKALCMSYLPTEVIVEKAKAIKEYVNRRISFDNTNSDNIHVLSPVDEDMDQEVRNGLDDEL